MGSLVTKLKYWLSVLAISVVLIAGSLAVSPIAIADDDDDDDDETTCTGTLLVAGGPYDDVIVPAGASCIFASGVTVDGNVEVESGASLDDLFFGAAANTVNGDINVATGASLHIHFMTVGGNIECSNGSLDIGGVTVNGDVKADGCTIEFFDGNSIGGEVEIEGATFLATGSIFSNTIGGDLEIENSGGLSVVSNIIGGNLQIEDNSGVSVGVWSNTVTEDLEYNGNTSTTGTFPSIVGSNVVGGDLECSDNTPVAAIAPFGLNTVTGDKEGECTFL